ncbi:MAG: tetraacyldisaccharide 4'-kinase [Elusimicrobia bacterium]|nr:tetraacyldisaccharide 4'-kinase [Elusimicrobiota bacterium]
MREFLYPFSFLYRAGLEIDRRITKTRKLPKPVISIGNITWGGTGKTPLVIKTARYLISLGLKPCILTRGYKKKENKIVLVSDGKNMLVPAEISGDEPYLISESVPGAIVVSGSDRFNSAKMVLDKFSPDVFILDDGFQHWDLERDLDIVCINVLNPFGNGLLIPSGILREPLSSLKRADIVVLNNCDLSKNTESIEKKLISEAGIQPIRAEYNPVQLTRIKDKKISAISELKDKPIVALSAIGENIGFKKTLEKLGLNVIQHFKFRDHHWFSKKDIKKVFASVSDRSYIVTTAKDSIRLKKVFETLDNSVTERVYSLDIELKFENGENIWEEKIKKTARFS